MEARLIKLMNGIYRDGDYRTWHYITIIHANGTHNDIVSELFAGGGFWAKPNRVAVDQRYFPTCSEAIHYACENSVGIPLTAELIAMAAEIDAYCASYSEPSLIPASEPSDLSHLWAETN